MIKFFPVVLQYFFLALFYYRFGIKKNIRLFYAGKCLVEKSSFRLPDSAEKDILLPFKILKRTVQAIWVNKADLKYISSSPVAIMGASYRFIDTIPIYIEKLTGKGVGYFIPKSKLVFGNTIANKIISTLGVMLYSIPLILMSYVSKHRPNIALIITEIMECIGLVYLLKKNNITEVHDFIPFEKDSNVCALILMEQNIYVNKLPSSGPLTGHNKIIITNCLTTSSRYHLDEINYLKDTIFVDKVEEWIPEHSMNYIDRYLGKNFTTPANVIGFYSSASWLRKMRNKQGAVVPGSMDEDSLIEALKQYIQQKKDIKLIIFLHPYEKELVQESIAHYNFAFAGIRYEIADTKIKSYNSFEMADVAIAVYSTVLFERLFCGFKTLFFPKNIEEFPVKESNMKNICPKEIDELFVKLNESLNISTENFYEKNGLEEYAFFGWKNK